MAIDIKELFVTDLDAGSGYWWSKEKVDKINYNFTQLSNGGMIGPQGIIGVDGVTGDIGPQGTQGPVGDKGPQGPQGDSGINEWEIFPEENGYPAYLFPRKTVEKQVSPISLKIGVDENEYSALNQDPSQIVVVNGTSYTDSNNNVPIVNLRVEHNGSINGYNFQFLNQENYTNKFKIFPGISSPEFNVIFTAQKILIKSKIGLDVVNGPIFTDSISIDSSLIKVGDPANNTPGLFNLSNAANKYTKSESALEYKKLTDNEIADNVLVSENTNGDLVWKPVKDVFELFPIGTIISIRLEEFRDEHFYLNELISITEGSPLNNIYGRGRIGTDFEGWYLCNGETWTVSQDENNLGSTPSFLTPNLNNFSYIIGSDGVIQPEINISNNTNIVLGAYNLEMKAVPNEIGEYAVTDTSIRFDNNANFESFKVSGSGQYCKSKMIHIVYLENPNLVWNNVNPLLDVRVIPTVVTLPVSNIGVSTVTSGGNIVSDGGDAIISKGVVWSTSPTTPTITTNEGIIPNTAGSGVFTSVLTNLSQETKYNVRAYATNSIGTSYGNEVSFVVPLPTALFCNAVWTTRNLDVSTYRNGDEIPHATTNADWIDKGANGIGAWCYYENGTTNGTTYGKLYNWHAVTDNRKLAPLGYRVPTNADWNTLLECIDSQIPIGNIGGKMKSTGTIEIGDGKWLAPNTNATNSSGFTGLPGGFRDVNGVFSLIGNEAYLWSSTSKDTMDSYNRNIFNDSDNVALSFGKKTRGMSVRLIKEVDTFSTVTIGTQIWTTKNLDVTTYVDGTEIPQATTSTEWSAKNAAKQAAWCYYGFNVANGPIYGKLYNWYAVNNINNGGLAPLGYHIPTIEEVNTMEVYLLTVQGLSSAAAAGALKSTGNLTTGNGLWRSPNGNATNITGFTALPGGTMSEYSTPAYIGTKGNWWTKSGETSYNAWYFNLESSDSSGISNFYKSRGHGMSIRLIKDQ